MYIRHGFLVLDTLEQALFHVDFGHIEGSWLVDEMKKTDHILDEFDILFKYSKWLQNDAFEKMQKTLILMALKRMSLWSDEELIVKLKSLLRCHNSFSGIIGSIGIGKEYSEVPLRNLILKALRAISRLGDKEFQHVWVFDKCIHSHDCLIRDMSMRWFLRTLKRMSIWSDEKLVEKLGYLVVRFQKPCMRMCAEQSQELALKIDTEKLIEKFRCLVRLQKSHNYNIRKLSQTLTLKCLEWMLSYDDEKLIKKLDLLMECRQKSEENNILDISQKLILRVVGKKLDKLTIKIR